MTDAGDAHPTRKKSEAELLRDAQSGDDGALGCLLMLHFDYLVRRLDAKIPASVRGVLSVEEVLQEAFAHAFRDSEQIRSWTPDGFRAWLRSVADHRLSDAIDKLKSDKRGGKFTRVQRYTRSSEDSVSELVDLVAADSVTASRIARRQEAIAALYLAIDQLSDEHREAIQHHYVDGKSVKETAQSMARSEGAVRGYLARGVAKLREIMERSSIYLSDR